MARDSYAKLVAILAASTRDVAAAEDALHDAFADALRQWPTSGVPSNPGAWLLAVARRRGMDVARRGALRDRLQPELVRSADLERVESDGDALPDRRAELLFACADPAIDPAVHTPLMLQVVLGLDAETVAAAFLSSPSAMAQRLVRAKRKIRDAGIAFRVPDPDERPARVAAVLEALYAAFGLAWDWIDGSDPARVVARVDLRDEAIHLARVLYAALPEEPEVAGLLALFCYCRARDHARRGPDGAYVPLDEQHPETWDLALIGEAERLLLQAASRDQPGRFQLEAAIQSAHLARALTGRGDAEAIVLLYDRLTDVSPTVGALVNRAAALAEARGAAAGLHEAERLPPDVVRNYQPWWALRAHLFRRLGRLAEANDATERAAALTEAPAVRDFLRAQLARGADDTGASV